MTKPTKKEYEQFINETWSLEDLQIAGVKITESIDNIGTYLRKYEKELFEIGYADYVATAIN
jgi:nuclear transport factor 2 (NTF2) superfamily protein